MDKVEMSEDVWSGGFCMERGGCCLCCFWFHLFCSFSFSFLFFFLFQSGNKRWIKALLSCGAVGWVFWRFIQTVVSIQPDFFELVDSFVSIGWKGVVGPGVFIFFFPLFLLSDSGFFGFDCAGVFGPSLWVFVCFGDRFFLSLWCCPVVLGSSFVLLRRLCVSLSLNLFEFM